eukprot:scaffold29038_cov19-Tisochrysis_lutea.AAC.5
MMPSGAHIPLHCREQAGGLTGLWSALLGVLGLIGLEVRYEDHPCGCHDGCPLKHKAARMLEAHKEG